MKIKTVLREQAIAQILQAHNSFSKGSLFCFFGSRQPTTPEVDGRAGSKKKKKKKKKFIPQRELGEPLHVCVSLTCMHVRVCGGAHVSWCTCASVYGLCGGTWL